MNSSTKLPFDHDALGSFSRRLASAVFDAMPEFQQHARNIQSGETDGSSLLVAVPSPTNDDARQLMIWVDEIATPSIGFGPDHTHESSDEDGIVAIIDRAQAILDDKLLVIEDVGGTYSGHRSWLDLREPDAIEEELTSPYSPGRALLKSWSGRADRQVSIDSL